MYPLSEIIFVTNIRRYTDNQKVQTISEYFWLDDTFSYLIPSDNGKFIMAFQEKLSYDNSIDRCERFGFKNTFLLHKKLLDQQNLD